MWSKNPISPPAAAGKETVALRISPADREDIPLGSAERPCRRTPRPNPDRLHKSVADARGAERAVRIARRDSPLPQNLWPFVPPAHGETPGLPAYRDV